ncbi:MAG TPA: NAD(P)-dependent oxidoreductase, partial [Clostridiaceae bacterium]|nr:NAD(P)-dependent oxidoreductase [Clostridiaceae bacterium]
MGFKERADKLIQRDDERYKEKPRDIRIDTNKLASHGIKFENTMDGIERAIKDFGLMF